MTVEEVTPNLRRESVGEVAPDAAEQIGVRQTIAIFLVFTDGQRLERQLPCVIDVGVVRGLRFRRRFRCRMLVTDLKSRRTVVDVGPAASV
jgi:hypothetical protein